jgi:hypothetical protein
MVCAPSRALFRVGNPVPLPQTQAFSGAVLLPQPPRPGRSANPHRFAKHTPHPAFAAPPPPHERHERHQPHHPHPPSLCRVPRFEIRSRWTKPRQLYQSRRPIRQGSVWLLPTPERMSISTTRPDYTVSSSMSPCSADGGRRPKPKNMKDATSRRK